MKGPLGFSADDLLQETLALQRKLAEGLKILPGVEDVDYGATARQEVWRDGRVVLYRFIGDKPPSKRVPLLIVYALVNRPYMVDLQADRSLVRGLLAQGEDVYVLDWGYPDRSGALPSPWRTTCCASSMARSMPCANKPRSRPSTCSASARAAPSRCASAALRPEKVRNLVTMVTPVDFHTPDNMLSRWTRTLDVDLLVDTVGNIPADLMNASYLMLKPFRLNLQKYVGLLDILDDKQALEDFLRMEKWIFDSPDLAGEAFREFVTQFYQRNGLIEGGIEIGGEAVDLAAVDMPVLNIYAEQDHLVPPAASRALAGRTGSSDYSELGFRGGHIGIYVSGRAQREVPAAIHRWLAGRDGDAR